MTALDDALGRRREASARFFGAEADRIARSCHRIAERFARGGRLLALARTPSARTDAAHVAVEFVHPVIVGKRALPALDVADPARVALLAEPDDIVLAFGEPADGLAGAVAAARARGCLTLAFAPLGADWEFDPPEADPFIRQELVETLYHVLWELVHVFFEHRGLLKGRVQRGAPEAGAAAFLYPFLGEQEHDLDAVLADVRASALMKAQEVQDLRERTLGDGAALIAAATTLRAAFAGGGRLLTFGNGGSATDAADVAADFSARPVLDLSASPSIITAIANDIGPEAIFARQLIACGRPGDAVLAFSTSGTSGSIVGGLAEARRRGLATIAFVGYDGGAVAGDGLADHVLVVPSQHIPRIQEVHATLSHLLCGLAA